MIKGRKEELIHPYADITRSAETNQQGLNVGSQRIVEVNIVLAEHDIDVIALSGLR
jgi:hypothetical protein